MIPRLDEFEYERAAMDISRVNPNTMASLGGSSSQIVRVGGLAFIAGQVAQNERGFWASRPPFVRRSSGSLQFADVDLREGWPSVRPETTKTDAGSVLPLEPQVAALLDAYINDFRGTKPVSCDSGLGPCQECRS